MIKGGVDSCDKMCAAYSVSQITRQWSLVIFYVMRNIARTYSHALYVMNDSGQGLS